MSKLSEEEIKDLAGLVRYSIAYGDYKDLNIKKLCLALIGALDLYNQEKEKRKELIMQEEIELEKFKDKIKEILEDNQPMTITERIEFYQRELRKLLEEIND